jgi:hypothetical protein
MADHSGDFKKKHTASTMIAILHEKTSQKYKRIKMGLQFSQLVLWSDQETTRQLPSAAVGLETRRKDLAGARQPH